MEESAKETVIIVHGTYAAPKPGVMRWYQPCDGATAAGEFVNKLDAALQKRGSPARCWAHCTQAHQIFHWSGKNSWIARTQAASELGAYVTKLRDDGWCCHIVAHSHGGNVVLEALPQITTALPNASSGKIVTLGTPFMDTLSPILKRIRWNRSMLLAPFIGLSFSPLLFYFTWNAFLLSIVFCCLFSLLGFWLIFSRKHQNAEHVFNEAAPKLLAIGSPMDEPWQLMHYMRNASNPMAVETNLIRYLISSTRARISRDRQVSDLTFGAKVSNLLKWLNLMSFMAFFLSFVYFWREFDFVLATIVTAFTLPFFLLPAILLPIVPPMFLQIATYVVRSRGWSVILAIATGLEDYPYQLPLIEQYPSFLPENFVKHENMPTTAEKHALVRRSAWVAGHLGDVSQTFSKLAVTSADITSLLQTIEEDQTLVHAAYYTEDECIARIADWIAGRG